MQKIKRSSYLFFGTEEKPFVDAAAFLRGEVRVTAKTHLVALSVLTGEKHEISAAQLDFLCRLSTSSRGRIDSVGQTSPHTLQP